MWFDGWQGIWRVLAVGSLAYLALVALLRISGKRTLSKLNAFDLVVTVALGSTIATVLLSKEVVFATGVVAFALLVALQAVITWLSVHSAHVSRWVKSEPALVFFQGRFMPAALERERLTEDEVRAAVRAQGVSDIDGVWAVVLETDGQLSVLASAPPGGGEVLRGVRRDGG